MKNPPRWQMIGGYVLLGMVLPLCFALMLSRLPLAQYQIILGLIVGVAGTTGVWLIRKASRQQRHGGQNTITEPQRVTARQALLRSLGSGLFVLLMTASEIDTLLTKRLDEDKILHLLVLLLLLPSFATAAVRNYRLYRKARREGPLVILPSGLPPTELRYLRNSKSVANLEHAVPESQLAEEKVPIRENTTSVSLAPAATGLPYIDTTAATPQIPSRR